MRSHRARRCAVVGLAATTLVLIGSSVLGTVSTRRSAETVARSAALAEAYDRAHDAVTSRPDPGAGRRACPRGGRAGEDGARGVLAERVERVPFGEPALDRYELLSRVALEADEDQAGVEEPVRVGARVVGVGPAQHPFGLDHRGGQRDVGVGLGADPLVRALPAPDGRLLCRDVDPVPGVQQQTDAADHEVGAAPPATRRPVPTRAAPWLRCPRWRCWRYRRGTRACPAGRRRRRDGSRCAASAASRRAGPR